MAFLLRRILYLSVIVTLLAAGTLTLVAGVILFLATVVPLRAALLITGAMISGTGVTIAYWVLSDTIVLKTTVATDVVKNEKP